MDLGKSCKLYRLLAMVLLHTSRVQKVLISKGKRVIDSSLQLYCTFMTAPIARDSTVKYRLAVGVVQNPVNLDLNLDHTLGSGSMFGVWLNQTSRTCPCSSSR